MTAPDYLNSLATLFGNVQAHVISQRSAQGLTPLVTGGFLFGQEQLRREHAPPRIVIVPTGAQSYKVTSRMPQGLPTGTRADINPKVFLLRLQSFEAHLWGQPTPTPSSPMTMEDIVSDFNDAVELERAFLDGLRIYCGNMPNLHINRSEFRQPTDDVRLGRLLVLDFAIETQVSTLPATVLTYATPGIPGTSVSVQADVTATFPDGSSTDAGTIVIP